MPAQRQWAARILAAAFLVPFVCCVVSPSERHVIEVLGGKNAFVRLTEEPAPATESTVATAKDQAAVQRKPSPDTTARAFQDARDAQAALAEGEQHSAAPVSAMATSLAPVAAAEAVGVASAGLAASTTSVGSTTSGVVEAVGGTSAASTSEDPEKLCKDREALRKSIEAEMLQDKLLEEMEARKLAQAQAEEQAILSGIDAAKMSLLTMNQARSAAQMAMSMMRPVQVTTCPPKLSDDISLKIAEELEDIVEHVQGSSGSAAADFIQHELGR
eukprot:TRINITY_DN74970_c0_g1_i1.p1 TRINITY_DN74970_c0_g1~~TRINITY_DN74970_c0_g1_i1.p1  ORF type:complete len:298 (-),score=57.09 TRINITY_DN74970_c0_g1_i1:28-846(-)